MRSARDTAKPSGRPRKSRTSGTAACSAGPRRARHPCTRPFRGGAMPKSKHQIPGRVRSAYEFIKAHRERYRVQMMCRVLELEGIAIVAKWRNGTYQSRAYTSWAKIRNPKYSQWDGRRDQGHKTTGAPNGRDLFSQDR